MNMGDGETPAIRAAVPRLQWWAMSKSIRIVMMLALTASIAHAEREEPPQESLGMYEEGTRLYNNDFRTLRNELMRACVGDPSQKWLERLAALEAKAAKLAKAEDKQKFVAFLTKFRAWLTDKTRNVPEVGTWDDARKAVAAMRELAKVTPPKAGTSDAEIQAMIDYAVKMRSTRETAGAALSYAENQIFGCEAFLAKPSELFPIRQTLDDNMQSIEGGLTKMAREIIKDKLEPFRGAVTRMKETTAVTSWDDQVKLVAATFTVLATAKDIVANEARYLALGAYASAQYGAEQAVPDAKRAIGELGTKLATMLEEVSFPQATGKDAARLKVVKAVVAGKKILNGPALLAGPVTKESFTEYEGGVSYVAKRETSAAYYVDKPTEWTTPVPDGVNAADLCEVHFVYLMRWTSGPPSRKKQLNNWYVENDRNLSPMLCKNAKRVSKLK